MSPSARRVHPTLESPPGSYIANRRRNGIRPSAPHDGNHTQRKRVDDFGSHDRDDRDVQDEERPAHPSERLVFGQETHEHRERPLAIDVPLPHLREEVLEQQQQHHLQHPEIHRRHTRSSAKETRTVVGTERPPSSVDIRVPDESAHDAHHARTTGAQTRTVSDPRSVPVEQPQNDGRESDGERPAEHVVDYAVEAAVE